jgi:hypothetical protein
MDARTSESIGTLAEKQIVADKIERVLTATTAPSDEDLVFLRSIVSTEEDHQVLNSKSFAVFVQRWRKEITDWGVRTGRYHAGVTQ